MTEPVFRFIGWDEFRESCHILASLVRAKPQINKIIPVVRGGLVPATILSHFLDDMPVAGMVIDMKGDGPDLTLCEDLEDVVVVDEVCDTGETFRRVRRALPRAVFAAPFAKPRGSAYVDLSVLEVPQHIWLVFPWERPPG